MSTEVSEFIERLEKIKKEGNMSGTLKGGKKAARTNYEKQGKDFYKRIGAMGGKAPYEGKRGFAANKELARIAGKKGGKVSKRKGIKNRPQPVVAVQEEVKYIKPSLWASVKERMKV